jgi:hypothetical protein
MVHRRKPQPSVEQIRNDAREGRVHPVPGGPKDGIKVDWCHKVTALFHLIFQSFRCAGSEPKSAGDWVGTFLPCWMWLRVYRWKSNLWRDAVAGLTVGIMVIPQGMSYAKLAGLPVQYGLYSALVPLYVYAMFGSSRHLSVGPVAITSLLLSTALSRVMEEKGIGVDDPSYESVYVQLAIQASFLVAVFYIGLALFRLGFITLLLSHAVISGFTSGAAIVSSTYARDSYRSWVFYLTVTVIRLSLPSSLIVDHRLLPDQVHSGLQHPPFGHHLRDHREPA